MSNNKGELTRYLVQITIIIGLFAASLFIPAGHVVKNEQTF